MLRLRDAEGCSIHVASTWRETLESLERDEWCQTDDLPVKHIGTQAIQREEVGVQSTGIGSESKETDSEDERAYANNNSDDEQDRIESFQDIQDEDPSLAQFITSVGEMFLGQLQENEKLHPFEDLFKSEEDCDRDEAWTTLYALKRPTGNVEEEDNLQCTSITWNATGSQIIAGYGRFDNFGWCNHRGAVCVWNIFARTFRSGELTPESPPDFRVETSSGVMTVAPHPHHPALFAAGTYNGEVLFFDLNKLDSGLDPLVSTSPIEDYSHREPILQLCWFPDPRYKGKWNGQFLLASVSSDGRVLFWDVSTDLTAPLKGYTLASQGRSKKTLGGTCMTFGVGQSNTFIVGSEGGALVRCSMTGMSSDTHHSDMFKQANYNKWSPGALDVLAQVSEKDRVVLHHNVEKYASVNDIKLILPNHVLEASRGEGFYFANVVRFTFQHHMGPVSSVAASPFHRNAFLSCGADGELRLYSLLEKKPALTWRPSRPSHFLNAVAWSPHRPAVFACVSSLGELFVFDLAVSVGSPVLTVAAHQEGKPCGVYSLSFNLKTRGLLVVGDESGAVRIIKLGWRLSNRQPVDKAALDAALHSSLSS